MDSVAVEKEKGFAEGEHVVLRPVLEDDLRELAQLMAENPYEHEPTPWTYQRLKKKFEDKDQPGLWERENKVYSVVRKSGGLIGFLKEAAERGDMYWCILHLGESLPDRDALGLDLVATYLAYQQRWGKPRRISFDLLLIEEQKVQWLEGAGFERELVFERSVLYRGEPVAVGYYTWIADWALARRAERVLAPGEDRLRGRE